VRITQGDKLVPQGRDQVAKLPLFVRTQTHSLGKSQQSPVRIHQFLTFDQIDLEIASQDRSRRAESVTRRL